MAPTLREGNVLESYYVLLGVGTFLGGAGSSPSVGQPGREQRLAELRLETVYPEEREAEVVAALREAHPYEEPAFDVYERL